MNPMALISTVSESNLFFSLITILPLLLLLLLPLLFFFISKRIPTNRPPIPPGPYAWPIIGNIFQLGKLPHLTITRLAQTHGPLMSLKLGSQLVVVGSSPAAAREILKTHDRILSGRFVRREFKSDGSKLHNISIGLADECDDKWRNLRSISQSALFSGKAMGSQARVWSEKIVEMVEDLRVKEGSVVEIGEEAFVVALNILSNVIFSVDFVGFDGKGLGGEMRGLVRGFADMETTPNLTDLFPVFGGWDLIGTNKKLRGIFGKMFAAWEGILKERRRKQRSDVSSQQHDLLDTLIGLGLTDDRINPFLLELFAAGTDSTTSTISWALAELTKNQNCMQKLHDELDKEIDRDIVRESNLPHLPYLEACLKETLRLHPPAPLLIPHCALQTCEVMGYTIPKDTILKVNVWAISRDPTIWDDPLSFKPERFQTFKLDYKGSDYEYLPFGSGRRMCPGQPLGAKVVLLILGTLVHLFDWSLPGNMDPADLDMKEKNSITLVKEQPLCLVPKVRKQLKG